MTAAVAPTTKIVTADGRMLPGIGHQTAASARSGTAATGPGVHAPAPTKAAATVERRGHRAGERSRHATTRRLSSTSALRRWAYATQVHGMMGPRFGATSLHGSTMSRGSSATHLSEGTTSPRVGATSLSDGVTSPGFAATSPSDSMSPRATAASPRTTGSATVLSTTPAASRRSAGIPTPRLTQHRRGVRARHPRKPSGVRRQRPGGMSIATGVGLVDGYQRRAAPKSCCAPPQPTARA